MLYRWITFQKVKLTALIVTSLSATWCIATFNFLPLGKPKITSPKKANLLIRQFEEVENYEQQCTPMRHFVYIKTHKTGSTTLFKVADKHRLRLNLKRAKKIIQPFFGGYPGPLDMRFIFINDSETVRVRDPKKDREVVFLDHFRYSPHLRDTMPKDTKYFTILRKPWSQFQSAFQYHFGHPGLATMLRETCFKYPFYHVSEGHYNTSIIEYLAKTERNLNSSVPWFFRSRNYQAFDLGLDPYLNDDEKITEEVERISRDLDLVLITEYFDHSLILLKDLLCMEWEDLIYQKANANFIYNTIDIRDFPDAEKTFNKLYKLDTALYNHFNATLWRKIDAYGRERMESDVVKLREMMKAHESQRPPKYRQKVVYPTPERERILFRVANLYRSPGAMTRLLERKFRILYGMDAQTRKEMAAYMVANGGGCPI